MTRTEPPAARPLSGLGLLPRISAGLASALAVGAMLAGCGGGVYVGYDDSYDAPPRVDLAVTPRQAYIGEPVELVAAASDDYRVHRVDFYISASPNQVVFLGSDYEWPYSLQTRLPDTPYATVSYMARAVDDVGQVTDTRWTGVAVLP